MSAPRPALPKAVAAAAFLLLGSITLADTPFIKRGPLIVPRRPFISAVGGFGGISTLAPLFPAPRRFAVSPYNRPLSITTYHIDATPSPLLSGGGYEGQLNFLGAPSLNVPALSAPNLTAGNYLDRRVYNGSTISPQSLSSLPPRIGLNAASSASPVPVSPPQIHGFRTVPRAPAVATDYRSLPPTPWRSPMRARLAEHEAQPDLVITADRQIGICLGRGDMAFENGQFDRACDEYRKAIELAGDDAAAHFSLGLAEFAAGRYPQSAGALRTGLALDEPPDRAALDLRACYTHQADFARHVQSLERSADEHPSDADAWLVLSFVRYYSGDVYAARRASIHYSGLRTGKEAEPFIRRVRAGS